MQNLLTYRTEFKRVLADGDKAVEHRDVMHPVPGKAYNPDGMF